MIDKSLFKSSGQLNCEYIEGYGYKAYVEVDKDISRYYRSLIPKWIKTNSQAYSPHITIVRNEVPVNLDVWQNYTNSKEVIEFEYENIVHSGTVYFWLNCFSKRLEEIRLEMGLPVSSQYTLPPAGFIKCFHCTIANCKNI